MKQRSILFTKMAGAGNDFIVIDAKKGIDYKQLTKKICDRTNGIGADGLLICDKSRKSDYKMRIINADGSEAEMCGNGARCLASYIVKNKKPKGKNFSIETLAGTIIATAKGEVAHVRLSQPKGHRPNIPLTINGQKIHVHYINTGVPHVIVYVDDLNKVDVKTIGNAIRFHKKFKPRGANVNFVEQIKNGLVAVRTYERGVEDETKACGTGSVAAAIVSYLQANPGITSKEKASMKVLTQSGETLNTQFDLTEGGIENVWLKGSAIFIAEGNFLY
ncbi:MAG: diaminopimelate epimerase [Candidatus Omnitrophica bacterium]|nr:diaminopimelate epimerase [Candidatus Omnitrophota bacterium]